MTANDKSRRPADADLAAKPSRRTALSTISAAFAAGVVGTAVPARAQTRATNFFLPTLPPIQPPRVELTSAFQFQDQASSILGKARLAAILDDGDRTAPDRITLFPRVNISTRNLDLTCSLFGDQHFTPIIVGPMENQKRFHPEGEVAMARGASAAKAAMILSCDSSVPLATIAEAATTPIWIQVYAKSPKAKAVLANADAIKAKAVVVTVNAGPSGDGAGSAAIDWAAVSAVVKGTSLPVIVKGITRPQDAREAVARGAKGVVVSNYRGGSAASLPSTLLMIEPVVQAVGAQVPVLADGGFRYGSDIIKALGFGASSVLIGRPVIWGLASYGASGVQGVMELLQSDLARFAAMCGRPTLASIDATVLKVHAQRPSGDKNNG